MRYHELTQASLWLPRAGAGASRPKATVITIVEPATSNQYCRRLLAPNPAGSADIEHIVVLDGEVECGIDVLRAEGVSRIVHPKALALPGLSAAEAAMRATGQVVLFLRPCWLIDAAAIDDLTVAFDREGADWCMPPIASNDHKLLLHPLPRPELLESVDPFDRLAFAIRRDLLDRIGLPDPHIAFGPHWLWDFANRARRSARELRSVRPVAVSQGPEMADPFIGTVPGAVIEISRSDRRDRLKPDQIADRNLAETSPDLWSCTNAHTQALGLRRAWASPSWHASSTPAQPMTDRPIVVYGDHDASVSLYFDGLPPQWSTKLRFVSMSLPVPNIACLAEAAVVIIARDVRRATETGIVDLLSRLGVPRYAFFDDNFTVLADEYPGFAYYTRANLTKALAECTGVIATSPDLVDWFRRECGVSDLVYWPCTLDDKLVPTAHSPDCSDFRVGMAGGPFRQGALAADVCPALDAIATMHPVALWTRDDVSVRTNARLHTVPYDVSFATFVRRWRAIGLHALVHPRGDTANLRYKTPNALLVALYVGAVPVVEADPAYDGLNEDDGVLVVREGRADWEQALRRLTAPRYRGLMYERLAEACRRRFAHAAGLAALELIVRAAPRVDVAELNRRQPIVSQWLAAQALVSWDRDEARPARDIEDKPVSLRFLLRHPRKALIQLLTR